MKPLANRSVEDRREKGIAEPFRRRRAGLLLHPTSLPGAPGNGDIGPEAEHFVDFLAASGITVWQMLPLGPTHEDGSPYQCTSAHAGNPRLISIERLVERGWLAPPARPEPDPERWRRHCLAAAHNGFLRSASEAEQDALAQFVEEHGHWLEDFALYQALREDLGGRSWVEWPPALRDRDPATLAQHRKRLAGMIEQVRFEQFVFFEQWHRLKDHAHKRGILLFGDIPIFVAHDSADVWAHRELFALDAEGRQQVVAGVPPDYFSETGQRWGNPHYRWQVMQQDDYRWWVERLKTQAELFDLIRIDHFRGFEAYWEIPATAETAVEGRWVKGPGGHFFRAVQQQLGMLPIVAEDLGVITEAVTRLRQRFHFPGMRILQFAFDGNGANPHLPHNHETLSVVYTGTHDNDTTLGWFGSLDDGGRQRVLEYSGFPSEQMPWPMIRLALASVARLAILPMQDVLALGSEHRMNRPGVPDGNWQWRFEWSQVPDDLVGRLRAMLDLYGRGY